MLQIEDDIKRQYQTLASDAPDRSELDRIESAISEPSALAQAILIQALTVLLHWQPFAEPLTKEEQYTEWLERLVAETPTAERNAWLVAFHARLQASRGRVQDAIISYRKVLAPDSNASIATKLFSHFWLADLYHQHGASDEAVAQYEGCVQLATESQNVFSKARALSAISEHLNTIGQYDQALTLAQAAIELSRSEREPVGIVLFRIRECIILLSLGEASKVIEMLGPIEEDVVRKKIKPQYAVVQHMFGRAYYHLGQYERAKMHLERAIADYENSGRKMLEANVQLHLTELLIDEGSFKLAEEHLIHAKALCEIVPHAFQILTTYEMTSKLAAAQHRYEEALEAYKEFHKQKEHLLSEQTKRRMDMIRIEHEVQQREKEAELLRLKSEQLERELMEKTGHLVRQAEVLSRFSGDIRRIISETTNPAVGLQKIKEKTRDLSSQSIDWEEYDKTFSAVHPDFKQTLLGKFPTLTPMEAKVCTLLRIELTSKEIANILSISERSVENHRYRARKKIGLSESESMHLFLSSI
ncbi:MAG: tetratricopeptide repeat protein [Bacteroidetes bacterium]|nr:tetratricopeptide repeat protein [Bacteroidota bacterium]